MSELFENLADKAEKLKESVESGELKEKVGEALEDVRERVAPVIEKVKDATQDAVEKVSSGISRIVTGEKPTLNVENDLFDELAEEAARQKDASDAQADEMQRMVEEILGSKRGE